MILYHVCSVKKFIRYFDIGCIKAPVRGWSTIESAEKFSKQTGRQIILRLNLKNPILMEGHQGLAYYVDKNCDILEILHLKKKKIIKLR